MVARKYVSLNIEYTLHCLVLFSESSKWRWHESNWASNASDQSYYDNDFVTAILSRWFFVACTNRLISVQLKTLNSLRCFLQVQNCWRWILSSLSAKKETQTKIGSSSVAVRDLFCPRPIRTRLQSNSFLICSLEIGFVWSTPAMIPVFLRSFTNALIIYLPGQRYWKTLCFEAACEGNDQWRL